MEVYLYDPHACVHSGNFTFFIFIYYNIYEEKKGFSLTLLRRPGFNHRPFHVGFVVDKVALG
jgi:hypothetical protein